MSALTKSVQILRDASGHPAFAVLPFAQYQALLKGKPKAAPGIPADVAENAVSNDISAARAWREHLDLTQDEVSKRMGVTQGAYAQLEAKKTIRKSSREKIAKALGIAQEQLDF